jgi:PBSX family phage terminase large subunit
MEKKADGDAGKTALTAGESGTVREIARRMLDMGVKLEDGGVKELAERMGMTEEEEIDLRTALVVSMARQGLDGNAKAAEAFLTLCREDDGEDAEENPYYGLPAEMLGSAYVDVYRDIRARRHRRYDFKGGRGSLKSSFCAEVMIDEMERNARYCAMAIRQIKETMKDSVYAQLVWAIEELGLKGKYRCTTSPLEIRRIATGQKIYFRGADDPTKIKSIRPPKDTYVGVVWIEEADQIKGREAERNILQSLVRGGDDIIVLRSYNTPASKQHFINREAAENRPDRLVHHSFFCDVPREWLGQAFLDEAGYLKSADERAYRHEYLGDAVGTGGSVFENVTLREITKEEADTFDRVYHGVDFGYYPDPWAYVKCRYDKTRRRLYIFDEAVEHKKNNRQTADILAGKGITYDDEVICDSADPKSIADYVSYGIYARGAEKGPGSVNYSMKWMQGLAEIVIDPARCPHTADEFAAYEYEKTRSGEMISGYPDKNNHCIDAARYATNLLWRQRGV